MNFDKIIDYWQKRINSSQPRFSTITIKDKSYIIGSKEQDEIFLAMAQKMKEAEYDLTSDEEQVRRAWRFWGTDDEYHKKGWE